MLRVMPDPNGGLYSAEWRSLLRRIDGLTERQVRTSPERPSAFWDRGELAALKWALAYVAKEYGTPAGLTFQSPDDDSPEARAHHVEALRAREEYLAYRIQQVPHSASSFDHSERRAVQRLLRLLPEGERDAHERRAPADSA